MANDRDKRRRSEPFGYPVSGIPAFAAPPPPPRDEFESDEENTGVRMQRILARAKHVTQNPTTIERRHAEGVAIDALVELLRASEQERRTRDMREEAARRDLEQTKRQRSDQRKTIWLSALGIIVPTLTALAALIAALRGHQTSAPPARDHGSEIRP